MKAIIHPSNISGIVHAPASKSAMQRACAVALIRKGVSKIYNPGKANDDLAALSVIQQLGAVITNAEDHIIIESNGVNPVADKMNCGESGLGIRMFTPIAAVSSTEILIDGEGSLMTRPMNFFDEILPQLNVSIRSNEGKLPLQIHGPLKPQNITVDGSLSSQFLTGLLMAYAAADASDVTISVENLKSKPYIDLTLQLMKDFGLKVPVNKDYQEFYFERSFADSQAMINYTVEGDWSGGAFLLVAGAIAGDITVNGLDVFSQQADKKILEALSECGSILSITPERIKVGPAPLKVFQFDATDCPDLFPPLVALAAYCKGTTVIQGTNRLTHKESNRAITLQEEFAKMGVKIELQDDLMLVTGGRVIAGNVSSRHDHRIAMACAVAALKSNGPIEIEDAQAVNKSYPDFYEHLQQLGVGVSLNV
jgi:3-phosphoshikimate 1-carboxyvinyltransferase